MALRITSLNRMKNGQFVARKSIPADVREAYARLYSVTPNPANRFTAHPFVLRRSAPRRTIGSHVRLGTSPCLASVDLRSLRLHWVTR
jgi:hypothetical protein